MDSRHMKDFVGVDVSYSRHRSLIEEEGLDRSGTAGQPANQFAWCGRILPGIRTQPSQRRVGDFVFVEHGDKSESPRVDETYFDPVLESHAHMGVIHHLLGRIRDAETAGHAEVGNHRLAIVQGGHQELAVTAERFETPVAKSCHYFSRGRVVPGGAIVRDGDRCHHPTFHGYREVASGDLDFREFRQVQSTGSADDYGNHPMRILPRPFSQVLNDSIVALGRLWKPLFTTSLMVYVPATALIVVVFNATGVIEVITAIFADPGYLAALPEEEFQALVAPVFTAIALTLLIQALATVYTYLFAHRLVQADLMGDQITAGSARLHAARRMAPALVALVIATVAILGSLVVGLTVWDAIGGLGFTGMLLLAVVMTPGVWLAVSLSMLTPVTSFEMPGIIQILRRSANLVRGRWGATLGFLLLVATLGSIASSLIQWIAPLSVSGAANLVVTIIGAVGIGVQGLIMAAIGVAWTHWYIDLRSRKEALLAAHL